MATPSEVKAGLDDIAQEIRTERQALKTVKARATAALNALNGIPTKYAPLIGEIDAYDGSDAFETLAKAEKAKLAAEFTALKAKAQQASDALSGIDFAS